MVFTGNETFGWKWGRSYLCQRLVSSLSHRMLVCTLQGQRNRSFSEPHVHSPPQTRHDKTPFYTTRNVKDSVPQGMVGWRRKSYPLMPARKLGINNRPEWSLSVGVTQWNIAFVFLLCRVFVFRGSVLVCVVGQLLPSSASILVVWPQRCFRASVVATHAAGSVCTWRATTRRYHPALVSWAWMSLRWCCVFFARRALYCLGLPSNCQAHGNVSLFACMDVLFHSYHYCDVFVASFCPVFKVRVYASRRVLISLCLECFLSKLSAEVPALAL